MSKERNEREGDVDWDAAYVDGNSPWDKGAPAPPLLEFLERQKVTGRVLVPGCGLGHDARAIAQAGADEVVGMDLSPTAVAGARALDNPPNLSFEVGDFLGKPPGGFDWVFEHTLISALNPDLRKLYGPAVRDALKSGGHYLAIFFMTPWDEGEVVDPPPWGLVESEIDGMFSADFETVERWEPKQFFPGREGRETMGLLRRL
jgi:SAM-dependent methyltransferase